MSARCKLVWSQSFPQLRTPKRSSPFPRARHSVQRKTLVHAMPQNIKLTYFDLPGRAETTRIMLRWASIPFEDVTIGLDEWPVLKPKMPFGQVPILEVDGKVLAQSAAIERYVAKLAGLIPEDLWDAAKVDEAVALVNEINEALAPTYAIQDVEARTKAREEMVPGPLKAKFEMITKLLQGAGGKFLTGDKPTYADIYLYKTLSGLIGGSMEGVPTNLLDSYPELKQFHCRVAALPPIAKMYENEAQGVRASYRVLS